MSTEPDRPPIVFVDTETTGLHADARAWEVAMIRRATPVAAPVPGKLVHGGDVEHWLMVSDVDLTTADLKALRIGGFHERHPGYGANRHVKGLSFMKEATVARRVEEVTRGAVLVGSNPAYDATVLGAMLRRHGLCPAWHYRTVDLPTYAAGRLDALGLDRSIWPDWRSEQTAAECKVPAVPSAVRHTALGDSRWIRQWWDVLTTSRDGALAEAARDWGARNGWVEHP